MKYFILLIFILVFKSPYSAQSVFDAARAGDLKRMEELYRLKADTLTCKNESGFTPLIIASYRNQIDVVEFLIKHAVDLNVSSPEGTALMAACFKNNLNICKLLLKGGADPDLQNEQGTSALIFAVLSSNTELVSLLIKHEANKDKPERSGKTARHYAQLNGTEEMITLFKD